MEIKNFKVKSTIAYEKLNLCNESNDLELVEHEDYPNTFLKVFGTNCYFLYVVEEYNNEELCGYERGVGYIYQKNNKTFLKRQYALLHKNKNQNPKNPENFKPKAFSCQNHTIAYSCIPPTYIECLGEPNCILTSKDPFVPELVHLEKNSFLMRFDDYIENVNLDDKRLIPHIIKLISNFTKQLKLSTSKLTTKRTETELLDLKPTSNPKPKVGSMYYDKDNDQVKVYTSDGWRTLSYLKDNDT